MRPSTDLCSLLAVLFVGLIAAPSAHAIPAFARKYGTSCVTCHIIFPKLTPFGEAFRRNGYRFPGVDGDYIKQEEVPLGQDAQKKNFPNSVWPGILPASVPIGLGANGNVRIHPDKNAAAAIADNGAAFSIHDLIAEAHIWAGGSFSEKTTFFAQLTFATDGSLSVEDFRIHFTDIFNLKHAFNLMVGKGAATLGSFGLHSSFIGDTLIAPIGLTGLYGAKTDPWNLLGSYSTIELTGTIAGRLDYSAGINAGSNLDIRPTENVYGHIGGKIGGMRLDGEGSTGPSSVERPWEETALTLDAFAYRSVSHFTNGNNTPQDDTAVTFGGSLRAQIKSLELDSGIYQERHTHGALDGGAVNALSQYNELAYIVFPWLVPAVRVEMTRLEPQAAPGAMAGPVSTGVRIIPGIAALVLTNLKFTLTANIEWAQGLAPVGGWGAANGYATPASVSANVNEIESVTLTSFYSF